MEKNSSPDKPVANGVLRYVPSQFGQVDDRTLRGRAEKAEAEAREKGFAEGYAKGLREGQREIEERLLRLESVIRDLDGLRTRTTTELMPSLLDLALEIAQNIIKREVELDRDTVVGIAVAAVRKLGGRDERMILKVNPSDYDTMLSRLEMLKEASGLKDIVIEPSSSITPGGCYIETQTSEVDGRIEEQLKEVRDALATALDS